MITARYFPYFPLARILKFLKYPQLFRAYNTSPRGRIHGRSGSEVWPRSSHPGLNRLAETLSKSEVACLVVWFRLSKEGKKKQVV